MEEKSPETKSKPLTSCRATVVVSSVNRIQQLVRRPPVLEPYTPLFLLPSFQLRRQRPVRELDNPLAQNLTRFHARVRGVLLADNGVVWEGAVGDRTTTIAIWVFAA